MKKLSLFLLLLLFLVIPSSSYAAKAKKQAKAKSVASSQMQIGVNPQLVQSKRTLRIVFTKIKNVKTITYEVTYNANGVSQGVMGTITPKKPSETRNVLLGTCSGKVCVYHTGITNLQLKVTATYKSGAVSSKTYPIAY